MEPATSPFGARRLSFAIIAGQAKAKACPAHVVVDKWKVLRTIIEARQRIGISDRAAAVLSALLSFHPETELKATASLVVFPSNRELSLRAHSMPEATLRRHLAALVDAGLIVRRDSPNGKRYVRRDDKGAIGIAYGFDLAPLVARAAEFGAYAAAEREAREAVRRLREEITLLRRDIAKTLAFVTEASLPGDWSEIADAFAPLASSSCRGLDRAALKALADALATLRDKARKTLEFFVNVGIVDGTHAHSERHKEESNPSLTLKTHFEVELNAIENGEDGKSVTPGDGRVERDGSRAFEQSVPSPVLNRANGVRCREATFDNIAADPTPAVRRGMSSAVSTVSVVPPFAGARRHGEEQGHSFVIPGLVPGTQCPRVLHSPSPDSWRRDGTDRAAATFGSATSAARKKRPHGAMSFPSPGFDLQGVLAACPEIRTFNRHGIASWRDLIDAATVARSALGIGADAWNEARTVMGDIAAATVVATVLERVDAIGNPGGYLRTLTAKARTGEFSPAPLLRSLLKEQARAV